MYKNKMSIVSNPHTHDPLVTIFRVMIRTSAELWPQGYSDTSLVLHLLFYLLCLITAWAQRYDREERHGGTGCEGAGIHGPGERHSQGNASWYT